MDNLEEMSANLDSVIFNVFKNLFLSRTITVGQYKIYGRQLSGYIFIIHVRLTIVRETYDTIKLQIKDNIYRNQFDRKLDLNVW